MKGLFSLVLILILGGLVGVTVYFLSNANLGVDDTDALYGGVPEFGYISAGYIINVTENSNRICGFSALSADTGITAAHCVDDSIQMYVGKNQYSGEINDAIPVQVAIPKEGWAVNKIRNEDFAILKYNGVGFFDSFAQVATPIEGCHYRVVAYGRTENQFEPQRPRKSAHLCAFDIQKDTFKVRGDGTSGICFGDSGSPIYFENTNKVVGVVASIIRQDPNDQDPCEFGNTAIIVRADINSRLIEENIQTPPTSSGFDLDNRLTIQVAEETLLEQLGLDRFQNLTERQRIQFYLYATIGGIILLVIIIIVNLLKKPEDQVQVIS